jgi:hypothetical protein
LNTHTKNPGPAPGRLFFLHDAFNRCGASTENAEFRSSTMCCLLHMCFVARLLVPCYVSSLSLVFPFYCVSCSFVVARHPCRMCSLVLSCMVVHCGWLVCFIFRGSLSPCMYLDYLLQRGATVFVCCRSSDSAALRCGGAINCLFFLALHCFGGASSVSSSGS